MKKILILATFIILALSSYAFAASPVLYFSDLIDGPKTGWDGSSTKGAAVTIWGNNFGSSRGSNYITVGGVNLTADADYAEWGITTGNARGLERITFFLNSNCTSGAGTISVTVNGISSNTLPFYVRTTGSVFFADYVNGNDSYNGTRSTFTGGLNGPKKTVGSWYNGLASVITPGSVSYIRAGTYTEIDDYNGRISIRPRMNGSANNYTAIVAYPGEYPVLDDSADTSAAGVIRNLYEETGYIVISKLKLVSKAGCIRIQSTSVGHHRAIGNDCDGTPQLSDPSMASPQTGQIFFGDTDNVIIYGNVFHDYGVINSSNNYEQSKFDHAVYIGTRDRMGVGFLNFDIGWNEIKDFRYQASGIYIHPLDGDNILHGFVDEVYVHDNLCYNLGHSGILLISRQKNVYIYNNIIYNCGTFSGRSSVQLNPGQAGETVILANIRFYNNTIYSTASGSLINTWLPYGSIDLKNNIIYSLSGSAYISASGSGTITSDYDLYYGNGSPPAWATNTLNSNPQFFNAASNDFHLQVTSPVKDAGTSTVNGIVTKDYSGIIRSQGVGYDIGAYEYAIDSIEPAVVTDLTAGTVTTTTIAFGWTAPGNDGNLGQAASYDIRYSTSNITDANWGSVTEVTGENSPSSAGAAQIFTISGLTAGTTYYFALKTQDYAGNISGISNIASATTSSLGGGGGDSGGGGGGGGGGGCFIATAAFGTSMTREVVILSKFRDNYLLYNSVGKKFVKLYLKTSPTIAKFIEKREWAKKIVRCTLKPVVWIINKLFYNS
jgi:hypothetical protein